MTHDHEVRLAPHGAICQGYGRHLPRPLRIVVHHVLPKTCGGQSTPDNEATLCDSCHYSVHALMYAARLTGVVPARGSRAQRALALRGYQAAQAAGTVDRIPDEGQVAS